MWYRLSLLTDVHDDPVLERLNALELEQKEAEEMYALKKKGGKEKSRRIG